MFGWSARSWFYNCAKTTKKGSRDRNHWLADILSNHREGIVRELDVQKVLSYLVYERVFSLEEYRDILSQECNQKQATYFLEKLAGKGPSALSTFCSLLEEVCPHLLVSILLDYQGVLARSFTDVYSENTKLQRAAGMEREDHPDANDLEGSFLAEDQINPWFNKYRSAHRSTRYAPLLLAAETATDENIPKFGFVLRASREIIGANIIND